MLFIGGALVSSAPTKQVCTNKASMHQQSKYAPTKQVCTNTAAHAAWGEAAQAAVERDDSRLCKCTHNKRITAIISFYCLSFRCKPLNLLMSNTMPDYKLA